MLKLKNTETQEKRKTSKQTYGTISIIPSTGDGVIYVPCGENDTIAQILNRAGIQLGESNTVTIGRKRVKNIAKTAVSPGDTLVIAAKISNG